MKYLKILILLMLFSLFAGVQAQTKGVGIGMSFGEPTGIIFKKWIDSSYALTGAVAYSTATVNDEFTFNLNYVFTRLKVYRYKNNFGFQYGGGVRFSLRRNGGPLYGLRGTAAGLWYPEHFPVEFSIEVAPVIVFGPYYGVAFDANAGVRYYFNAWGSK